MKTRSPALFLFPCLAGLLAGCANPHPPASQTEPWTPPADTRQDTVWQEVRDRKPVPDTPLSLLDLADLALQNNAATRKAWNEARAASEQVRHAEGYFMPSVSANAAVTRVNTAAHPDSFDQNYMSYGPGLQLNYLICNFGGGRRAAVEQAMQTVYAANFTFNQAIQETLLAVQTAYYNVISTRAAVDAAATNSLDSRAILDAATDRRDAGLGIDLDVLQARTGYEQSLYALAEAQGRQKIAEGLLARALNVPADTAIQIAAPETALPPTLSGQDLRRLTDDALARRPDLSALRAALSSREAAVRVARASRWPSLYASGSVTRDYNELYGFRNRDMAENDFAYTGGLNLQWNLFDGLQTLSTVRTAEAQADAARAQLQQAELAASAEIWSRFHAYETALRKHDFSSRALETAAATRELAFQSYNAGIKNILDLLSAENQLAQTRSQWIAARQEVFTALASLAYATGQMEKGGMAFNERTE